jgi:hypothetical protein
VKQGPSNQFFGFAIFPLPHAINQALFFDQNCARSVKSNSSCAEQKKFFLLFANFFGNKNKT